MDIFKLSALAFILYLQVHNAGASPSEDGYIWNVENLQVENIYYSAIYYSSIIITYKSKQKCCCRFCQEKPQVTDVLLRIADLMKRSKSQHFHGLTGSTGTVCVCSLLLTKDISCTVIFIQAIHKF